MFAWEQRKLGDVCEPITDSIDTQKYPNEVFSEYSMPAFDASMKPDIVLGSSMNSVRKIITRPCLLVNKLNVRKKRIWYVKKPNKNAVCSAEFIPLHSDTVDLTFLNQVAKSETFTRYLENHSSGSSNSQKRITPRSLMLSKLHIPTIEEQKLIGKIFEYLDHTITLHEEKKHQLERLKSALLQKMFTDKSGDPDVRFKGFDERWERHVLNDLAIFNPKCTLPTSFEYVDLGSVIGVEMISHKTISKFDAPSRAQRLAQVGDLFYQTVRPYQQNNYLFDNKDNAYVFSTGYAQLRPLIDGYFLLCLVQTKSFVRKVMNACTGTSYPAINSQDLAQIRVNIPINSKEQRLIGNLYKVIDNLVTLYQRKLDDLNTIKQSLLQKMFI
ncbi:restriction endonuclease subunit S [Lactobacillus delbrueckii subsp. bulgaricus]